MTASTARRSAAPWLSLSLFSGGLAVLYAGRFVQFDDTSGFGGNRLVLRVGLIALLLVMGAIGVALSNRTARRALGGALAVLDVLVIVAAITDDGFRFIWSGDKGELFLFEVTIGLVALFFLTPAFRSPTETTEGAEPGARAVPGLTAWARCAIYLSALVVTVFVAFSLGTWHFVATQCSDPELAGECDVAVIEGLAWAVIAVVLGLIVILTVEVVRSHRRRGRRRGAVAH